MQFEDVTLPPILSFLLIYIFILILTKSFVFSHTNLLFVKSNLHIIFSTHLMAQNILFFFFVTSISNGLHSIDLARSMPEVNLLCVPGRAHAHRLFSMFPNTHRCQKIGKKEEKKAVRPVILQEITIDA